MNSSTPEALNREEVRFKTFVNWPLTFMEPKILAMTGFYFSGSADVVTCYFCQANIGGWEPEDNEITEHQRWSRNCPLIRKQLTNNVPIDAELLQQKLPVILEDVCGSLETINFRLQAIRRDTQLRKITNFLKKIPLPGSKSQTDKYPEYLDEVTRLNTYENWPRATAQKPQKMMEAGFFYTSKGDRVKCFSCEIGIRQWNILTEPWIQHILLNNTCHYLRACKSSSFIAIVLESQKIEKNKLQLSKQSSQQEPKNSMLCKICYCRDFNTVFIPCGHVMACTVCANAITKCPICREDYERVLRVYLS